MTLRILVQILFLVLALFPLAVRSDDFVVEELSFFQITSAITPATYDYLERGFKSVRPQSIIIIKLNTPGGLVTTTKDIITLIGSQKKPVIIWITPEGATAASAGAIVSSSAHAIFMSPGTRMGAATPVGLGGDLKESDGKNKAMNDLKSLVRALSFERSRPAAPFEEMIEKASSFTDREAQDLQISETVSESNLIPMLDNRVMRIQGRNITLRISPEVIQKDYEATPAQKILNIFADPTMAYFIFLLGIALLYFEFQAPGGYVAGSVGTCLLVIAAMSFQVLPFDWGALGLLAIGFTLLVIEIYVTSYGLLFLTGMIFFILGSLFLFQDNSGFISIHYSAIYSSLGGVVLAMAFIVWYLWREKKRQSIKPDFFLPLNSPGIVLARKKDFYQVRVQGEIWNAFSEETFQIHDSVIVTSVDKDKLLIQIKKST